MVIHFSFLHGIVVDEKTRAYMEKKIDTAGKMLEGLIRAEAEISQDKRELYKVEVSIFVDGSVFRAEEMSKTIEEAIDKIEKELQEQIRDNKERAVTEKRRGGRSIKKKLVVAEDARF